MTQKTRCQSCGMPLVKGFYGTETDGKKSSEYCKFCYMKGAFTEPAITMDEMIKKSIHYMAYDMKMNDETAEHLAKNTITTLRRWRTPGR